MFLEILQNPQENTCARDSFLMKLQASGVTQVFSCKFWEISKNTFIYKTPPVAASWGLMLLTATQSSKI